MTSSHHWKSPHFELHEQVPLGHHQAPLQKFKTWTAIILLLCCSWSIKLYSLSQWKNQQCLIHLKSNHVQQPVYESLVNAALFLISAQPPDFLFSVSPAEVSQNVKVATSIFQRSKISWDIDNKMHVSKLKHVSCTKRMYPDLLFMKQGDKRANTVRMSSNSK